MSKAATVIAPEVRALIASVAARKAHFVAGELTDREAAQLLRDIYEAKRLKPGKGGVIRRSFAEIMRSVTLIGAYASLWQANPVQFMRVQATFIPALSRVRPTCEGGATCKHFNVKDIAFLATFHIFLGKERSTPLADVMQARKNAFIKGELTDKDAKALFIDLFKHETKQRGAIAPHDLPSEYEIIGSHSDAKHQGGQLTCGAPRQEEIFASFHTRVTSDDVNFSQLQAEANIAINFARSIVQLDSTPNVLYVRMMRKALDRDERSAGDTARVHPYATRIYVSDKGERASDRKQSSALLAVIVRNPGKETRLGSVREQVPHL